MAIHLPDNDEPEDSDCLHTNLMILEITEWVGDGEGPAPRIYQCEDCDTRYLVTPGQTLITAIIEDPRQPGPDVESTSAASAYFKTEVQQAVEALLKIVQDPEEDAVDRLEVAKYIIEKELGA